MSGEVVFTCRFCGDVFRSTTPGCVWYEIDDRHDVPRLVCAKCWRRINDQVRSESVRPRFVFDIVRRKR